MGSSSSTATCSSMVFGRGFRSRSFVFGLVWLIIWRQCVWRAVCHCSCCFCRCCLDPLSFKISTLNWHMIARLYWIFGFLQMILRNVFMVDMNDCRRSSWGSQLTFAAPLLYLPNRVVNWWSWRPGLHCILRFLELNMEWSLASQFLGICWIPLTPGWYWSAARGRFPAPPFILPPSPLTWSDPAESISSVSGKRSRCSHGPTGFRQDWFSKCQIAGKQNLHFERFFYVPYFGFSLHNWILDKYWWVQRLQDCCYLNSPHTSGQGGGIAIVCWSDYACKRLSCTSSLSSFELCSLMFHLPNCVGHCGSIENQAVQS